MAAKRRVKFPCCLCNKACGIDTIQCTDCNVWLHRKCTRLTPVQFSAFDGADVLFVCPRCLGRRDNETNDWSVPLCKLKDDPFPATAWRVRELLDAYNAAPAKMPSTGATMPGVEDARAVEVLKMYQPALLQRMSLRATFGDGNCCYRSV